MKAIILAACYLHLILVEAMPQIAGRDVKWQVESFRIVDRKGRVRQMFSLRLRHYGSSSFLC